MGFPENEWHGHDLTSLIDGCAKRLWARIKDVSPWDEVDRVHQMRVKEAVIPNVTDVLDEIHEQGLEALTTVNNRLLDGLEEILSEHELSGQGFSATERAVEQISALTADARNGWQEV